MNNLKKVPIKKENRSDGFVLKPSEAIIPAEESDDTKQVEIVRAKIAASSY